MTLSPEDVLKQYWGYDEFRPLQRDIIGASLSGRDVLVLMPTGGGKSICYQVPGMMGEGLCLVISPLIALMKDQVGQLSRRGIKAKAIFSGLSHSEIDLLLDNAVYGDTKFLYVSPERLGTDLFRERVQRMPVRLIAVDEAHCISQWGYDFRPAYREIRALREWLPDVPVMALTASATPRVRTDIVEQLGLEEPTVFEGSFRRPNISMVTRQVENKGAKLLEAMGQLRGSGIVYVRSRRKSREIAELLSKNGYKATWYHAGLKPEARTERQRQWMEGETPVMVSTNAFGMGIDRAAVRFVVHWDLPDSLEAYYQEAGRAGRDGKMSYALLLYGPSSPAVLRGRVTRQFPELTEIRRTYNALCNHLQIATGSGKMMSYDFDLQKFCRLFKLEMRRTYYILRILEQEGYLVTSDSIHLPSRIKFTITRRDIYKFQVENEQWDRLIQALLRTYGGIADQYVMISERYLAERLKVREEQLKKDLVFLKSKGVLQYIPYRDNPSLTFLKPRLRDVSLTIDTAFWKTRRKVISAQVESMIGYAASKDTCKQVLISQYFGEENTDPCGKCSVCVAKKVAAATADAENELLDQIREKGSVTLAEYLAGMGYHEKQRTTELIRRLADDGRIRIEAGEVLRLCE